MLENLLSLIFVSFLVVVILSAPLILSFVIVFGIYGFVNKLLGIRNESKSEEADRNG